MLSYYRKNYAEFEVFTNENFATQKIWKVSYDVNHDLIFVFVGKLRHIKGQQLVKFIKERKNLST